MKYKVYKITNIINGKLYIGITKERYLKHRFWAHANKSRSAGAYLHWSIKKYGKKNFTMDLLYEYESIDECKLKEIELISTLKLNKHRYPTGIGMNLTDGGDGSYGCKHKLESIKKMSGINNHNYGLVGLANPTSKPIKQYSLDGIYIKTFSNMREAAEHLKPGSNRTQCSSISTNIRNSIIRRNNVQQAYGYTWEYV